MPDDAESEPADSTVSGNVGDARWSIPIELPPGPGGFAPEVALQYSSARGDGAFGVGWGVPQSEIACSTRFGVPAYIRPGTGACPRFELDGELLNAAGGDRYHTFVESFQRIRFHPAGNFWEVTAPGGITRRYGTSDNSRVRAPGGNVARWLLAELENPYGQVVHYRYDGDPATPATLEDPITGFTYLANIAYGPSSSGPAPERQIRFVYEPRPDRIADYFGGLERVVEWRAREIAVQSTGGQQHSRWLLGYDLADIGSAPSASAYTTARSRLSWVQRLAADCTSADPLADCTVAGGGALPAQEFVYSDPQLDGGPSPWLQEDDWNPPPMTQAQLPGLPASASSARYADINGDGLVDSLRAAAMDQAAEVRLNTGSGWGADPASPLGALEAQYQASLAGLRFAAPRLSLTLAYHSGCIECASICSAVASAPDTPIAFKKWGNFPNFLQVDVPVVSGVEELPIYLAPPNQFELQLLGNFHVVDLDADGLADLVMSVRVSGLRAGLASLCPGVAEHEPLTGAQIVRVAFRNDGNGGWTEDGSLIQGDFPLLGHVIVEDPSYVHDVLSDPASGGAGGCEGLLGTTWPKPGHGDQWHLPCLNTISFSPVFTDLNGDGRIDVIAAEADCLDEDTFWLVNHRQNPYESQCVFGGPFPRDDRWTHARSRAWISREGGSWERAAEFDLPFSHFAMLSADFTGGSSVDTRSGDLGIRLVDLNRDGYPDLVWENPYLSGYCPGAHGSYCARSPAEFPAWPSEVKGVLVNRGAGTGAGGSAWCSSRPLATPTGWEVDVCPPAMDAARFELPDGVHLVELMGSEGSPGPSFARLADFNGDGWPDLARALDPRLHPGPKPPAAAWLYSPEAPGGSVWVRDDDYAPPVPIGPVAELGGEVQFSQVAALDVNGDAAADWVRHLPATGSGVGFLVEKPLPDLLSEVRTGRGGVVQLAYTSSIGQRDAGLEAAAGSHAAALGEPPAAGDIVQWVPTAVVTRLTIDGPNREPASRTYRYAHARFCLEHRSRLGFRLVEETGPDGVATTTTRFYQHHGRAGRLADRSVSDHTGPLHTLEETWALVAPGSLGQIPGAWGGDPATGSEHSRLAQLAERRTCSESAGSAGACRVEHFSYDSNPDPAVQGTIHGYDFVHSTRIERASTSTLIERFPAPADTAAWIVGLVAEETTADLAAGGLLVARTQYAHTPEGAVAAQVVTRVRQDGIGEPAPAAITSFEYDAYGNRIREIDPRGHATEFCYDNGSVPAWCTDATGAVTGSLLLGRLDPPLATEPAVATHIAPDPVFGLPLSRVSEYGDVPATRVALDAFGREIASFATPLGGAAQEEVRISRTDYMDGSPSYAVTYRYSEPDQPDAEAIRSAVVEDGFGEPWKRIRPAGVPGSGRHRVELVYRDPARNLAIQSYQVACAQGDALCSTLRGDEDLPASVTTTDALGRPISVATEDGAALFHYAAATETVIGPGGIPSPAAVDVVWEQNPKGDLVRRLLDGERLLAVEECTNSDPARTLAALALESCAGTDNRSLYGYRATGQLETLEDPLGNQLRYSYDTAGNVIRIDDPDAGTALVYYDAAGNLEKTQNRTEAGEFQRTRHYAHDARNRLTGITTPPGEPDYALDYTGSGGTQQLRVRVETGPSGIRKRTVHDELGRLWKLQVGGSATKTTRDLQDRPVRLKHTGLNTAVVYEYEGAFLKRVCEAPSRALDCSEFVTEFVRDVQYDQLGRLAAVVLPGGTRSYSYDDGQAGSGPERRHLAGESFLALSGEHWSMDYGTRDPLGNIQSWSSSGTLSGLLLDAGQYEYDHGNRLARRQVTTASPAIDEYFHYDALGNLIGHGTSGPGVQNQFFGSQKPHAIAARSGADELSYAYDAWGNLQTRSAAGGPDTHYRFDSGNRLTCVGSAAGSCDVLEVSYDSAGNRLWERAGDGTRRTFVGDALRRTRLPSGVSETRVDVFAFGERVAYLTRRWEAAQASTPPAAAPPGPPPAAVLLLPAGALLVMLLLPWKRDGGRRVAPAIQRPGSTVLAAALTTALAAPFPLAAYPFYPPPGEHVNTYRWVLSDPLGSGVLVVDATGDVVRHTRFKPFGQVDRELSGESDVRRFYAGHSQQEETGLTYMKARWMSPETGSFLSVDPWIEPDDPQSHTGYSYARNNPVYYVDPTGKNWQEAFEAAIADIISYQNSWIQAYMRGFTRGLRPGSSRSSAAAGSAADAGGTTSAGGALGGLAAGIVNWIIGENFGSAWRSLFQRERVRTSSFRLPQEIADAIEGVPVPDDAADNGMHAWHAGSNAAAARKLGLVGLPLILLAGILHETPVDWGSFLAEQEFQGTLNHAVDSGTDILANVVGLGIGYALPTSAAVSVATSVGNLIPGPGEPDPTFGGAGAYSGNPVAAWGTSVR